VQHVQPFDRITIGCRTTSMFGAVHQFVTEMHRFVTEMSGAGSIPPCVREAAARTGSQPQGKDNTVARLVPPRSCPVETPPARIGLSVGTLARWRAETSANAAGSRGARGASRWAPVVRLEAVIAPAAISPPRWMKP
jgi:hypothetical protein